MKKAENLKYLMGLGHFCSDINQSALGAMLPFFIASYHYDYATATSLVTATNLANSLIQPLIGHLSDKKELPYVIPLGLLLAGGGHEPHWLCDKLLHHLSLRDDKRYRRRALSPKCCKDRKLRLKHQK